MEKILRKQGNSNPLIKVGDDGASLFFEGNSLPEDANEFYKPLFEWVNKYKESHLYIEFAIYYMNTSSTKILFDIFDQINANQQIKSIIVNWHYEADDEDMVEIGQMWKNSLERIEFTFFRDDEII